MDELTRKKYRHSRNRAISTAMQTVGWPAVFFLYFVFMLQPRVFLFNLRENVAFVGLAAGTVIFAAVAAGWLANRMFSTSTIPVARMAFTLAILFNATVFGWILHFVLTTLRPAR